MCTVGDEGGSFLFSLSLIQWTSIFENHVPLRTSSQSPFIGALDVSFFLFIFCVSSLARCLFT